MKNLIKDASGWVVLLPILFLSSCKEGSAFGGGLWFIPVVTGLAAAWSFGRYFFGWGDIYAKGTRPPLVYAIILTGFTIGAILLMLNEK